MPAAQARWSDASKAAAHEREPENTLLSNAASNPVKALATQATLNRLEWCIILAVVLNRARTVPQIAAELGRDADVIEPLVDGLVQWWILARVGEGVAFQPDAERWRPPAPNSRTPCGS